MDGKSESNNPRVTQVEERRQVLAILARAERRELAAAWAGIADKPEIEMLRQPECGLVMARGRIGGGGRAFNVGEVTATRATVRLASGEVGTGHILGRDGEKALLVARFDALWQSPRHRADVETKLLSPVTSRLAAEDAATRAKVAATKVNFFTLVRGEDE